MNFLLSHRQKIEKMFDTYASSMLLYAHSLINEKSLADDIVQEIFVNLLETKTVPNFPKSYLWQAVHNKVCNIYRKRKMVPLGNLEIEYSFSHPCEKEDERKKISIALHQLPQKEKEVVIMKIWGNLPLKRLAIC